MKSVALTLAFAFGALAGAAPHAQAQIAQQQPTSCSPAGGLHFVCDLINVEDFLPIDGGRWLVGSSFKAGSAGLYLIDTSAKTAKAVSLSIAASPDPLYTGCTPPDLKGLSTHGLDVAEGPRSVTVYAINHGGRESVEIFRLNARRASAAWIGCVLMPPGANGNAITVLKNGSFAVTKFLDTADKQAFRHVMSGQITGAVYFWAPGKGFSEVPGTQLCGDNGLIASRDGKWLFINAYGTRKVYRVPLSGRGAQTSVDVDFNPDNLRWAPDGKIFVTGQFVSVRHANGHDGWAVVKLDPRTMILTPVLRDPGSAEFDDATSTVQIGHTLWFGTFRGDRVAYRSAP
jgi:hypothetical protein